MAPTPRPAPSSRDRGCCRISKSVQFALSGPEETTRSGRCEKHDFDSDRRCDRRDHWGDWTRSGVCRDGRCHGPRRSPGTHPQRDARFRCRLGGRECARRRRRGWRNRRGRCCHRKGAGRALAAIEAGHPKGLCPIGHSRCIPYDGLHGPDELRIRVQGLRSLESHPEAMRLSPRLDVEIVKDL